MTHLPLFWHTRLSSHGPPASLRDTLMVPQKAGSHRPQRRHTRLKRWTPSAAHAFLHGGPQAHLVLLLAVTKPRHDGSSASTAAAGRRTDVDIRVVGLKRNGGRRGALYARGRRLLLADADGARRLVDIELLLDAFDAFSSAESEVAGIVMGSRAHLVKTEAVIKLRSLRSMTGHLMSRCTVLFLLMHNSPSFATFSCTVCTPSYAAEASDMYTTLRRVQAVLARHGPRTVPGFQPQHLATCIFNVEPGYSPRRFVSPQWRCS